MLYENEKVVKWKCESKYTTENNVRHPMKSTGVSAKSGPCNNVLKGKRKRLHSRAEATID